MTARDSYRDPDFVVRGDRGAAPRVRHAARRASYVEIFIEILAGKDVRFRHGEDADFETELSLEARIQAATGPKLESTDRYLVGGKTDG